MRLVEPPRSRLPARSRRSTRSSPSRAEVSPDRRAPGARVVVTARWTVAQRSAGPSRSCETRASRALVPGARRDGLPTTDARRAPLTSPPPLRSRGSGSRTALSSRAGHLRAPGRHSPRPRSNAASHAATGASWRATTDGSSPHAGSPPTGLDRVPGPRPRPPSRGDVPLRDVHRARVPGAVDLGRRGHAARRPARRGGPPADRRRNRPGELRGVATAAKTGYREAGRTGSCASGHGGTTSRGGGHDLARVRHADDPPALARPAARPVRVERPCGGATRRAAPLDDHPRGRARPVLPRPVSLGGNRPRRDLHDRGSRAAPLLDKQTVREHEAAFRSPAIDQDDGLWLRTAGSRTGLPFSVFHDRASLLATIAFAERERMVEARLCGRGAAVLGGGDPLRRRGAVETAGVLRRAGVPAGATGPARALGRHAARRDRGGARPATARRRRAATARILETLGRFVEARGRGKHRPAVLVYGGDALPPAARAAVESRLDAPLLSRYGASEAPKIAYSWELRTGFHLYEDVCHVEIVDEQGRPVPPERRARW